MSRLRSSPVSSGLPGGKGGCARVKVSLSFGRLP